MSGYGYQQNFYSNDAPPNWQQPQPNWQQRPPPQQQQQYGYAPQNYQPYQEDERAWEQRQYDPYPQQQRYGSPYERGMFAPPPPQYNNDQRGFEQDRGERKHHDLGGTLAGAAAGGFLGHELKGGPIADIGGALLGAWAGHKFEAHEHKKHDRQRLEAEAANGGGYGGYNNGRDIGNGGGYGGGYDYQGESRGIDDYRDEDRPRHHHHHGYRDDDGRSGTFTQADFEQSRW